MTEINGRHVLAGFVLLFGIIIAVNVTMAVSAVRTFPGLVVKNSYVASQSFEAERQAQDALGWTAAARIEGGQLHLTLDGTHGPARAEIESAVLGRPTHVAEDQVLSLAWTGRDWSAPVTVVEGRWLLHLVARADDGTAFRQTLAVRTAP